MAIEKRNVTARPDVPETSDNRPIASLLARIVGSTIVVGLAWSLAALAGTASAAPASISASVASKAKSPALGEPVRVNGSVRGTRARAVVRLQVRKAGRGWRSAGPAKRTIRGKFGLRYTPRATGRIVLRVRASVVGKRTLTSRAMSFKVRARAKASPSVPLRPGPAPSAPSATFADELPEAGGTLLQDPERLPDPPAVEAPVAIDAGTVTLVSGSTVPVPLESSAVEVTSIESMTPPLRAGLALVVNGNGSIEVSAARTAVPGDQDVTITATGCVVGDGCDRDLAIRLRLTVTPLAPASSAAPLESFTDASPDRLADALPTEGPGSGVVLPDQLTVLVGTADQPGDRAQAERAAQAVGATVTGGIEPLGMFELRWPASQDLDARKAALLGQPGITDVDDAVAGALAGDADNASWLRPEEMRTTNAQWAGMHAVVRWPLDAVYAQSAWSHFAEGSSPGSHVGVAVVEGGSVYVQHEDLSAIGGGSDAGQATDHATHVAGLACARRNGVGIVGVAWGCPISSRNTGATGYDGIVAALWRAARTPGVRVINMSFRLAFERRGPCLTRTEQQSWIVGMAEIRSRIVRLMASDEAKRVVWVAAAGNECSEESFNPVAFHAGHQENVITVAALNAYHRLASFSNFGRNVKVAAPGGLIANLNLRSDGLVSTVPPRWRNNVYRFAGSYSQTVDGGPAMGTSMAAPFVSGTAALVWERFPTKSANEIARCIVESPVARATVRDGLPAETGGRAIESSFPYTDAAGVPVLNANTAVQCSPDAWVGLTGFWDP